MSVYQESVDDSKGEGEESLLPPMKKGDVITLLKIRPEQHFTEPPPRYTEASLVKTLEEHGIGRPSTYASIISTLTAREYVTLEKRRFQPTDVGRVVSKFLTSISPNTSTTPSPPHSKTTSTKSRAASASGSPC